MVGSAFLRIPIFALVSISPAALTAADYRGMSAGWPPFANGYYAANYPANYGVGPAYYVARPAVTAGYAAPAGAAYVPTTAAYANPTYFAAYGRSPAAYRPVSAGYSPTATGYYAPTAAYYAPTTANYAPANSYAVTPAGLSSAGSEAAAYYGQATPLNYVPPRVAYRTTYMPVPVYMYRPVTAYQPVTGQPVTCMQASTCTSCQPQRTHVWWNPLTWFRHGSCGSPPPTTAYCGTGCPQPYYPVQPPVVPIVPAPSVTVPQNIIPTTPAAPVFPQGFPTYPAQPTVPPPPTRTIIPGPGAAPVPGRIVPGTGAADFPPRLTPGPGAAPGPIITPVPSTTVPSQPGFTPLPGSVSPGIPPAGGSFPTGPGTQPGAPGFGTGMNYAPTADPYSTTLAPAGTPYGAAYGASPGYNQSGNSQPSGPPHSVFGSGYRATPPAQQEPARPTNDRVIRAPELGPALPPSVQTVPDLDAPQPPRLPSNAPSLLDPRDKTAGASHRWAVVPAQWPTPPDASGQLSDHPAAPLKAHEPTAVEYDDRGWKSAAF